MLITTLLNALLVAAVVIIHYQALYALTQFLPRHPLRYHWRLVVGVLGALFAHVLEIALYGMAYYGLHHTEGWGELRGNFDGSVFGAIYFSFTTYTTLGFGDIEPWGNIRLFVGIEALTGLLLITWSASFLFIEMQRYWKLK